MKKPAGRRSWKQQNAEHPHPDDIFEIKNAGCNAQVILNRSFGKKTKKPNPSQMPKLARKIPPKGKNFAIMPEEIPPPGSFGQEESCA